MKSYPPGVPADVDTTEFSSLKEIIEESCQKFRRLPAYSNMGVTLSYADLDRLSQQFGAYLQHDMGLKKGDRVAIMMPNLLQYPVAVFGALRAGMVVVNVNPMYTPRELEHQLSDADARAIVILENFATTLQKVMGTVSVRTVITTQVGDLFPFPKSLLTNMVVRYVRRMIPPWDIEDTVPFTKALSRGASHALAPVALTQDDLAFLQYTGGTTGVAKGAMLTHGNMVANLQQVSAWLSDVMQEGEERGITPLPLYHIFSLNVSLTLTKLGGENVLITDPRDMPGFVKELAAKPFTFFSGVNTLFIGLLNTPGFADVDFGQLKGTLGAGMAVQAAVAEQWRQVTGKPLVQAYGLTETSPAVCINPLTDAAFNGSVGLPIPSTIATVRDEAGNELPVGEVGEICMAGPQVMNGYWRRDEETAEAMTPDGALRTGDMGRLDENGYLYIADRKKDMILVSGFNVYPSELESVLVSHPGVLEAAAVGLPDAKSGEAIKIFIVRKDPQLTEQQVKEFCREQLTGYKVPRFIEFRDDLPKSNVGKVLRRELRDAEVVKLAKSA